MSVLAEAALDPAAARRRLRSYSNRGLTRLRAQEALNALGVALTVSLWVLAVLIFAERLFSLRALGVDILIPWLGFTALGIPYILWRICSPRLHERLAAVLADDRLGLHARLSTALTLDLQQPDSCFARAFLAEALARMSGAKVQAAFPIKFSRAYTLLLLPLLACAGLFFLMPPQDTLGVAAAQEKKRKAEAARDKVVQRMEARLEDLKKKADEHSDEQGAQAKINQIMQKADAVAKELKEGKREPEEAAIALGQFKREVQEEKNKLQNGKEFLDRLKKLHDSDLNLENAALTREISEALKQGDANEAARQMRKLAQSLRKDILDDPKKSDEQKKQELEKLTREVEKLAGALAEEESLREGLQELSRKTLSASEFEGLQSELKKQLEKQGKGSRKLGDDVQQQMEEIAERLEEAEEYNDPRLSDDEKKQMEHLDEVEEGLNEAMQELTGVETAENQEAGGKKAAGKTGAQQPGGKKAGQRGGQRAQAGKARSMSGRAAGDGQSDAQGQSSAKGQGNRNQDSRREGKPGDGLGSGPGLGSRPYRDGDAEFEKQKVKGQLREGAITGLTHFRGQGAKDGAPQQFVDAMKAAREEAESSLELERIPADARDVVKQYYLGVNSDNPPAANTEK